MRSRLVTATVVAALLSVLVWSPATASTVLAPTAGPNTGGTLVTITATGQVWSPPVEVRVACGATDYLVEASTGGWGVLTIRTPDVTPFVGDCALSVFSYQQPFRFDDPVGTFTFTGVGPTGPADCRDGGWQVSPAFANEGDCIRFTVANQLRNARVSRLDVDFAIANIATDTSGWYPLQPGVTYTRWSMELSYFESRDEDGRLAGDGLNIQRSAIWLGAGPGGVPSTFQQATLCARATDWTYRIDRPARGLSASGTLTLFACGTTTAIGTVPFALEAVATSRYHEVGLIREPGTTTYTKVNEWDDDLLASLTIDGQVVATGLTGALWGQKWERHTVDR